MGRIWFARQVTGVMYGHQEGSGRIQLAWEVGEGGPGRPWCRVGGSPQSPRLPGVGGEGQAASRRNEAEIEGFTLACIALQPQLA